LEHEDAIKEWDSVIKPASGVFDLNLRDVWRYRDLLVMFVKRDFVSFYKQTILGPLWFFIQPLFTTIIYVFIFGNLAGLSPDGLPQPLFYMSGIIAWNYFSDCLTKTSTVFRDNASIFGKVYFPRLIMPLSIVASNLVKYGVQLLLLVCMFLYFILFKGYAFSGTGYLLLYPVMVVLMAAQGLGLGMIISALTTKYRDLSFLISFGVTLFMYATPVIYPMSKVPEKFRGILELNPMSPIIEGMRLGLLGKGDFTPASLIYSAAITAILLLSGTIIFTKVEKNFVDTI
jgi:lipopolysaccharide transport system permease protein